MADLNVAVELSGVDRNATGVVKSVISSFDQLTDAATKPVGILGNLVSGFGKLGLAGLGIKTLADTAVGFATSLVSGNSEMEKYETQLGTLMGSADGARERLKELAEFGARTPFELPEIAAAEKVLLGFGLTGEKVFNLTGKTGEQFREVVGDIAAGTGASFQEIALNMGKFSAGATGEAIARFQEMGIATREQLAGMGVEFSKSGELMSPLPVAMQAIVQLAQQKFGGGMEKLSKTFEGQMSTLSDNINQAKVAIMQPIFNVLRDSLASVNEFISSGAFQAGLQSVAKLMADLVRNGIDLAVRGFQQFSTVVTNVIAAVGPTIQMLSERFTTFFGSLAQGATLAQTINAAFGDLIPASLNPVLDAIDTAFAGIKSSFLTLLEAFQQGGFAAVWQQITDAMSAFAPTGERLSAAVSAIGSAIKAIVPQPIQDFVSNILSMGQGATQGADPIRILADVVNAFSGAISDATQFIRDHVAVQAALVAIMTAAATAWAISAAVTAYTKAIQIANAAVQAYTAVQTALNIVLTANPIGIVVVALGALAAALIYAYNNSDEFRQIVDAAFANVKTVVIAALQAANAAINTFASVVQTVANVVSNTSGIIAGAFETARGNVVNSVNALSQGVNGAFTAINDFIVGIMDTIQSSIMNVWDSLPADVQRDLTTIYNGLSTRFGDMLNRVTSVMGSIANSVTNGWNTVSQVVSAAMGIITGIVVDGWNVIAEAVGTAMTTIGNVVNVGWSALQGIISSAMGAVQEVVSTAWEAVRAVIDEKIQAAVILVTGFGKQLADILGKMKDAVLTEAMSIGRNLVEGIKSGANAVWQSLVDWAVQQIKDLLGQMARAIRSGSPSRMAAEVVGQPIMQGVTVGLMEELPATIATAKDAAVKVVQAMQIRPVNIFPFGTIRDDIQNNFLFILNQINDFNTRAKEAFLTLNHYLRGWIDDVIAHRTELLFRFNFAAYLRGEGTRAMQELNEVTDQFIRNSMTAASDAAAQLEKIARDVQEQIGAARTEAINAAQAAIDAANKQIDQIRTSRALQAEIKAQRDAFAVMQRQARDFFDATQRELESRLKQQENIARINYNAQVKLSRIGLDANPGVAIAQQELDTRTDILRIDYEMARDLQRAKTDDERNEIVRRAADARQALQDQLDEEKFLFEQTRLERERLQREQILAERQTAIQALIDQQNEELAIQNATATLRGEIATRQAEFDMAEAARAAAFEQSMDEAAYARQVNQIFAERDARIQGIGEALAEKEKQIAASVQRERETILAGLEQQLRDIKTKYVDAVSAAFHHAGVDIADFLSDINDKLAVEVDNTSRKILQMVDTLNQTKQSFGNTPGFIPITQPLPVNQPNYGNAVIPPMPQYLDNYAQNGRQISYQINVTTTQPVTADQIGREVSRSLLLA